MLLFIIGCEEKSNKDILEQIQKNNKRPFSGSGSYTFQYELHDIEGGKKQTKLMKGDMESTTSLKHKCILKFQGEKFLHIKYV